MKRNSKYKIVELPMLIIKTSIHPFFQHILYLKKMSICLESDIKLCKMYRTKNIKCWNKTIRTLKLVSDWKYNVQLTLHPYCFYF